VYQNYLRDPFSHAFADTLFVEVLQIPLIAPYEIQLTKMPLQKSPNITRVLKLDNLSSAFTEVFDTNAPLVDQCTIDYLPQEVTDTTEGTGRVLFNSANAGEWVVFEYSQVGDINLKENIIDDSSFPFYHGEVTLNTDGVQAHRVFFIDNVFYAFVLSFVTNTYHLAYKAGGIHGNNTLTTVTNSAVTNTTFATRPFVYKNRAGQLILITDTDKYKSSAAISYIC